MAQYIPALAPAPDVTPNASAKGNATIVDVSAPKMSPLMVCLLKCDKESIVT
jgi:hypothetical protein